MDQDIRAGKYLENGDFEGNLYGTKVDSIRDIMRSGKMCILDVNPTVSLCSPCKELLCSDKKIPILKALLKSSVPSTVISQQIFFTHTGYCFRIVFIFYANLEKYGDDALRNAKTHWGMRALPM